MDAVVMAGGMVRRLGNDEKPLTMLLNRPMIYYVLIIMADLPLVTPELIDRIIEKYGEVNTPALAVHMRLDVCSRLGLRPDTVFHKNSDFIVPCGVNILDADRIREEQEDYNLILDDEELALNVNTQEDLAVCERYLKGKVRAVL